MSFDIEGARAAGYSDAEITQFLAEDHSTSFDVKGALAAGYSPGEVVGELSRHPAYAAGKDELERAATSPAANHFTTAMSRGDYERQFLATNPQASRTALNAVLAQYDQQADARAKAADAVQKAASPTPAATPEEWFNDRLNARLQGKPKGVVPQLPARISPDMPDTDTTAAAAAAHGANASTFDTVAGNLTGGALNTLTGALASGAHMVGADEYGDEIDAGRAEIQARQQQLGGATMTGKVAGLVGGILPALAVPEGAVEQLVGNAGLFAKPAFDDTLKAKLAEGYSRPLALAHAAEAFGINLFMPTVASRGAGAIVKGLGQAEAAGLRGAAVGLGQAAGEGVGFSALNTVADKGTDVIAGQKNDRAWLDPEDMAVQALGFGALRAGHMVTHAAGGMIGTAQEARARAAVADIGRASNVDDAIAAASAAVSATPSTDNVADLLRSIRPLDEAAAAAPTPTDPMGRVEPTLGEVPPPDAAGAGMLDTPAPQDTPADHFEAARAAMLPDLAERAPSAPDIVAAREPAAATKDLPAPPPASAPDEWRAFPPESGTLGIPRAEMPQIQAEHRGAMTNFLNARGIAHEQVELPADSLKPTQAEFSTAKVQKAREHQGGERSILVSSDGHVLDGHHQWLAAAAKGEPVKAIRLDAPIDKLLEHVKEFPSATTAEGGVHSTADAIPRFQPHEVEDAKGKKIPGLSAEFDNGRGSIGVMELGIKDQRLYPTWVDSGLLDAFSPESSKGSTGGRVRAMYEHAIAEADKRGLQFTSDSSVATNAARIYESLAKRGYEVEKNPAARLAQPPEVITSRWLTDDGSPVFTVKRERAAAQAEPVPEHLGAAPKTKLSIGKLPNSAEPVTVRDGVVHIGEYPAQDFETGNDITVPAGATPQQIKEALTQAGAIGRGNKVFGMPKDATAPADQAAVALERNGGVPRTFLKKMKVDHDIYIEDEGRWHTAKIAADKALKSVREDISNLEAMLNCMKG